MKILKRSEVKEEIKELSRSSRVKGTLEMVDQFVSNT